FDDRGREHDQECDRDDRQPPPVADAAGDGEDRDAERERGRVQRRGARSPPCDPLVDAPVDLLLDPLEEAGSELRVVLGPELAPGGEGRLELPPRLLLHGRIIACRGRTRSAIKRLRFSQYPRKGRLRST